MMRIFFAHCVSVCLLALSLAACNTQPAQNTTAPQQAVASNMPPEYQTKVLDANLPSPRKEMSGNIGEVGIVVNYGSPSVKGREVWGALVPYGEVWRTGANEATTIQLDKSLKVGSTTVPAGKYSLFTVPQRGKWELILNKTAEQWGAYEYNPALDAARTTISGTATETSSETLEFIIENGHLILLWEKMRVELL